MRRQVREILIIGVAISALAACGRAALAARADAAARSQPAADAAAATIAHGARQ